MRRFDIKSRFEEKFRVTPGCWIWTASTRNGYGRFRVDSTKVTASRFSYELYVGPIDESLFVCHKCDNPSCVNPDHLFLGSRNDNTNDMIAKGRNITEKKQGTENSRAKLTNDQVILIRKDTRSQSKIAADYGVQQAAISKIKLGKLWRHVPC